MHLPISQLKKEPIQFSSSKILSIHQYSTLHLLFIYAVAQQRYLSKLYRTVLLILLKEYTLNWLDDFFYWHSFLFNLNVLKPPIILIILLVHFFYPPTFVLLPKHFPHPVYNFTQNNFRISNDFLWLWFFPHLPLPFYPANNIWNLLRSGQFI